MRGTVVTFHGSARSPGSPDVSHVRAVIRLPCSMQYRIPCRRTERTRPHRASGLLRFGQRRVTAVVSSTAGPPRHDQLHISFTPPTAHSVPASWRRRGCPRPATRDAGRSCRAEHHLASPQSGVGPHHHQRASGVLAERTSSDPVATSRRCARAVLEPRGDPSGAGLGPSDWLRRVSRWRYVQHPACASFARARRPAGLAKTSSRSLEPV